MTHFKGQPVPIDHGAVSQISAIDELGDEEAILAQLIDGMPSVSDLSDDERAWLNKAPVGREIWWRDDVMQAELPDHLKYLRLTDYVAIYGLAPP